MGVYVAAIRLSGGTQHEHITNFLWVMENTYQSGVSSTANMVTYVEQGNSVKVSDGVNRVQAYVVRPQGRPAYLQTQADGKWTDNLLALPRF